MEENDMVEIYMMAENIYIDKVLVFNEFVDHIRFCLRLYLNNKCIRAKNSLTTVIIMPPTGISGITM
jgi:hypothetical protein